MSFPPTPSSSTSSLSPPAYENVINNEGSPGVSDDESPMSTSLSSDTPPRLPPVLTRSRSLSSMTSFEESFIQDFMLRAEGDASSDRSSTTSPSRRSTTSAEGRFSNDFIVDRSRESTPKGSPDPTRSRNRSSSASTTHASIQDECSEQRTNFLIEPRAGRKSPQEIQDAMSARWSDASGDTDPWPGDTTAISSSGSESKSISFTSTVSSLSLPDHELEIEKHISDIDNRLSNHILPDRERQRLFNELCKICSRYRMIPDSMIIPEFQSDGGVEVTQGGSAYVWQSTYRGICVAVKVFRVCTSELDAILSKFCREGVAWKHLRHPNILPLLGVTIRSDRFAMISEWMDNGNINQFIEINPQANRPMLLVDVANGLKYLHDLQIVHADLKGANILINRDKRACIADFGLVTITAASELAGMSGPSGFYGMSGNMSARSSRVSLISTTDSLMSFTSGGTYRWMSPELLDPGKFGIAHSDEGYRPTMQSDCFAFAMVIYEVLCGHHPFDEVVSDYLVVDVILQGGRPEKPKDIAGLGFTTDLWRTLEKCWEEDRTKRPTVEEILPYLNDATLHWYMRTVGSVPPTPIVPPNTPSPSQIQPRAHDYFMCEQCKRRPKCRKGNKVYRYCGLTCAKLAQSGVPSSTNHSANSQTPRVSQQPVFQQNIPGPRCRTPGCEAPAFVHPSGASSPYCSITHKKFGEQGCISCRTAPRVKLGALCQPCYENAMITAPIVITVPDDHENFGSVEKQFIQSWRHNTTCPNVRAIYKIISTEGSLRQYQRYLDVVEARGNFIGTGKSPGNEKRRWHGTKRKCFLGDPGHTELCADPGCSLCCIIKTSFDLKFFRGGRFGPGIYTSSVSSKSNEYSKNVGIQSNLKPLLLSKVVVGNGKVLTQRSQTLTAPPPGFDSVIGEVNPGTLNYDRLVVYNNDAVRPSYLVMYESP